METIILLVIGIVVGAATLIFGPKYFNRSVVDKVRDYQKEDDALKAEQDEEDAEIKKIEERIKKVREKLKKATPQDVDDYFNNKYGGDND